MVGGEHHMRGLLWTDPRCDEAPSAAGAPRPPASESAGARASLKRRRRAERSSFHGTAPGGDPVPLTPDLVVAGPPGPGLCDRARPGLATDGGGPTTMTMTQNIAEISANTAPITP